MTYAQRKQNAIENAQAKLDEAREQREWDEEEQTQQAIDDKAETDRQAEVHPLMRSESPGVRRAQASAREWFREHRPERTDEAELAASPFGPDSTDADDDDDAFG